MKKFKTIGISLLVAACAACLSLAFVACSGGEKSKNYGAGEEGFYYYDGANSARYMLSLQSGTYMITAGGEPQYSGSYSYNNETGEISFSGDTAFTATVGENALSLDMGDSGYSFKAYKYFDVTYVDENGVAIANESVLNGQSAEALNIEKDGYWFVGWFEDANNSSEFAFDMSIAGNTTVYGWYIEKNLTAAEYEITLDYGDGTTETVSTMNGVVWTLPADGILGWWVSATNKPDELTYRYETGTAFTADTTLYAVYSGMGASVTSSGITWENVTGADVSVTVYKEDGAIAIAQSSTSSSNSSYAPSGFTSLPAGTYTVKVTSGSTTEYLTYVVNGLSRVSKSSMDVIVNGDGRVISFAPIENATGYEITISDGTKTVTENLGSRTYYNFSSWEMTKEGFTFTVTAYADGYISSVSDAYTYILVLSDVTIEIIDDVVTWNRVDGALEYEVIIYGDDNVVLDSFYTTDTSYSLKYYDAGTYTISVQPKTDGYYSEAKKYEGYGKSTLAAPVITDVMNYSVSWSEVTGAISYEVMVGGTTYTVTDTVTLIFSEIPAGLGTYEISVKAIDENGNDSPYSDAIYATEGEFSSAVRCEKNTVYWDYDIEAASYVISVNGTDTTVGSGNSWEITLNRAGENKIIVTAYDASGKSLGQASMTVYAYSITLDPNGAAFENSTATSSTIYVAQGDILNLGEVTKEYADFVSWYTQADYTDGQSDEYEGKGSEVADGSVFTGSRDMYLYAYWTYRYIDVTLVLGDGTLNGTTDSVTVSIKYNSTSTTLPVPTPSTPMEDFVGWYAGPNGSSTSYTDGMGEWTTNYKGDETLYAYYLTIFSYQQTKYNGETVYAVSVSSKVNISRFTVITIPTNYDDYPLIINSGAFENCVTLETINIPDTVLYISSTNDGFRAGTGAFAGCSSLTYVNVYATGETGEPVYFSEDGVLFRKLSNSDDVEIMYYPYGRSLTSYTIPAMVSNGEETEWDGSQKTHNVTSIPAQVFRGRKLSGITIPTTVTTIASQAFYNNTELVKVIFEACGTSELTIADNAFRGCTSITEITLPARYDDFNTYAFTDCSSLLDVYVEVGGAYSSVEGVLLDSNETTLIFFPTGRSGDIVTSQITSSTNITGIGYNSFASNKKISSVVISDMVTLIDESAFEGCSGIASVEFLGDSDSSPLTIKTRAFYGCVLLEEIVLPSNLTNLEVDAFGGCSNLAVVTFDSWIGATSNDLNFEEGAFGSVNYITRIELGPNVPFFSNLGSIFDGGNLQEVVIEGGTAYYSDEEGVVYNYEKTAIGYYPRGKEGAYTLLESTETVGADVFVGRVSLTSITIGSKVSTIADGAFEGCTYLTAINVDSNNNTYGSKDGILYAKDASTGALTKLLYCPIACSATDIEVDSTVTSVAANAFYENKTIVSVKFTSTTSFEFETAYYAANDNRASTFYNCGTLTTVVLPDRMTQIPAYAFYDCEKLSSINIPADCTEIGDYAFYYCYALTGDLTDSANGIKLPEGLLTIGKHAFELYDKSSNIGQLAVTIPSTVVTIDDYAFYGCWNSESSKVGIVFAASESGVEDENTGSNGKIGDYAFARTRYATEVTIPARFGTIGEYAFYYLGYKLTSSDDPVPTVLFGEGTSLTSLGDYMFAYATMTTIAIPATVTSIGANAFMNSSLKTVTFGSADNPSQLTSIGASAFSNTSLTSVVIPASVTEIGASAFTTTRNLTSVTFGEGSKLTSIGNSAFFVTMITEITIPASVTMIGTSAFSSCSDLEKVTFETKDDGSAGGLTAIPEQCFNNCYYLKEITLPSSITSIGDSAFNYCEYSLTSISIPSGVTKIGSSAFKNCYELASITFEVGADVKCSLEEIGSGAFSNCKKLTEFTFPETSKDEIKLGTTLFEGSGVKKITLCDAVKDLDTAFAGLTTVEEFDIGNNTDYLIGNDGQILYNANTGTLVCAYYALSGEYTVPEGVTEIGDYAFYGQTGLTGITFSSSVARIGAYAFYGCSALKHVALTDNLSEIAEYCFYGCDLSEMTGLENVKKIGTYAFSGSSTTTGTKLTDVNLASIETIDSFAFAYSALTSVSMGSSLKNLGTYSFRQCLSLKSVTFTDNTITEVTDYAFYKCTALKSIYIPDGVTTVGAYVLDGCTVLEDVILPDTLKTIGSSMFTDCKALETCVLPASLTTTGYYLFDGCTSLKTVVLPEALTSIDMYCFRNCSSLENIEIGENVTSYGNYAFSATAIKTFTVGKNVTSLGIYTFQNCSSLEYVYTGELITSIGTNQFYGCTALKTVEFGATITSIGANAFYNCKSLENISLSSGLRTIGASAFYSCTSLESVYIPSSVTSVGSSAFASCTCEIYVENTSNYATSLWSGWSTSFAGTAYYYMQSEPGLNDEATGYDGDYWYYDEDGYIAVWEM